MKRYKTGDIVEGMDIVGVYLYGDKTGQVYIRAKSSTHQYSMLIDKGKCQEALLHVIQSNQLRITKANGPFSHAEIVDG